MIAPPWLEAVEVWKARKWPPEPPGWIFLAHALETLGPALEPGWTGDEFVFPAAPPSLPQYTDPLPDRDASNARNLLQAYDPAFALPDTGPMGPQVNLNRLAAQAVESGRGPGFPFRNITRDMTALRGPLEVAASTSVSGGKTEREAYARAQALAAEQAARLQRAERVDAAITNACLAGEAGAGLESAFRHDATGLIHAIAPSWWNVDDRRRRFASCRIDWANPTAATPGKRPSQPSWLYLRADTVAAYLGRLTGEQAPWWPAATGITLTTWAQVGGPADAEARRRLKAGGNTSPAVAHICDELAVMWNLARKPRKPTTGGSIETLRGR